MTWVKGLVQSPGVRYRKTRGGQHDRNTGERCGGEVGDEDPKQQHDLIMLALEGHMSHVNAIK